MIGTILAFTLALAPQTGLQDTPPDTRGRQALPATGDVEPILAHYSFHDLARDLGRVRGVEDDAARAERLEQLGRTLAELVRAFAPLDEDRGDSVEVMEGFLILSAPSRVHSWVGDWLQLQRQQSLIDVSARFIEAPRGWFREQGLEQTLTVLEPAQQERLLQAVSGGGTPLNVGFAPRLLTRSAQRANLSTLDRVAYVKEWQLVVVEPGGQELADPVVDTVEEGITMDVLGSLLPDGTIGLDLEVSRSKLERPIPTRKVRLRADSDREVEVGLPSIDRITVASRVRLADGATLLFTMAGSDDDRDLGVLLRAKAVQPSEVPGLEDVDAELRPPVREPDARRERDE